MTVQTSALKRFIEDLKRRHVIRVAVGYIIVSWVVLQVADVLLPAFDVGEWVVRALVTIAFAGFFITLILSWVFDISGKHVVRTRGRNLPRWVRFLIAVPLIVMVGAGSWWVWSGYMAEKESALHPTSLTKTPIVAVMPFKNLTGNPELDWYAEGLANLVRDNLTRSRYLRVVSPQKLKSIIGDATDMGQIGERGNAVGIGFILGGEMLVTPTGISVTSRLSDTEGGVDLSARQTEGLTPQTLLSAAGPIAAQVKQGLKVPRTEQVDIFAADFATRNLSAYEAYVAGLGFFLNFQYQRAEQSFSAALQLAPDFAIARYRLAYIEAATGRTEMAVNNISKALEVKDIPDREKRYIEAARALFSRDYTQAARLYEALLGEYPFEIEARELLAKTYWGQYRTQDAIREMRLLSSEEPQNKVIWSTLGGYLLAAGEFDQAQPALERYAQLAPGDANSYTLLGDSLRYQGQFAAARVQYGKALAIDPKMRSVAASLATIDYLQTDYQTAQNGFAAIVADESLIASERLDALFPLVALLTARGDFVAADSLLEEYSGALKEEKIRLAMAHSIRALLKLEMGNEAAARELATSAVGLSPGVPTRYLFARGLIELHMKAYEQLEATASEISNHALPATEPDRTEDKAAAYLRGLSWMAQGELLKAETELRKANELHGYAYRLYALGLAKLFMLQTRTAPALELIRSTLTVDNAEPRIDLEPERVWAILLSAEVCERGGDKLKAAGLARQFLSRFDQAGPANPSVVLANAIISDAALARNVEKKGSQMAAPGR